MIEPACHIRVYEHTGLRGFVAISTDLPGHARAIAADGSRNCWQDLAVSARLRLRTTAAAESAIRGGHPWVYSDSIREQNREGESGELAVLYDRRDRFLAIGLFDPDSPLRVRILHRGKPVQVDAGWWAQRLRETLDRRLPWFDEKTSGYRYMHGESDGWPGLVLDRYDQTVVIKLYTGAWLARWDELRTLLNTGLGAVRLVLRLSRNIQTKAQQAFGLMDGQIIFGPPIEAPVTFLETGLRFEADVLRGQKTGFFLDQRENRRRIESLARGREVLNVFSFSGGFSLYAARGGASFVCDLDMSAHALESSRRNFALNVDDSQVRDCRTKRIQADAFDWLENAPLRLFDLIVLDPPSLAKREAERGGAVQAYRRLVRAAVRRLRPGGILLACSCSAHVSAAEFFEAVRQSVRAAGRGFDEIALTHHPPDHPATFPEAEYLKGIYLRLDGGR